MPDTDVLVANRVRQRRPVSCLVVAADSAAATPQIWPTRCRDAADSAAARREFGCGDAADT
jgi:hypothetical protein